MAVNFELDDEPDPLKPLKRKALLTELDGPAPSPAPVAQGDTTIGAVSAGGPLPVSAVAPTASTYAQPGGETPPVTEQPPQTPTTPTTPTQPADPQQSSAIPPLPVTGSFNSTKWNNPAHQSDKYKAGRYLAGGGTLQGAAQLLGPGWSAVGDDVLRAPDGSEFDVYLGFSETGTQRVQWTQISGPGGMPMPTNAGTGGPYSAGTNQTIGGIANPTTQTNTTQTQQSWTNPSGKAPTNWDEAAYLKANPDVAAMMKAQGNTWSGWDHYVRHGKTEGRPGSFKADTTTGGGGNTNTTAWTNPEGKAPWWWDEEAYLKANPDVRKSGGSGWDHYIRYGKTEGRPGQEDPLRAKLIELLNNKDTPSLDDPALAAQATTFRNAKQREGDQLRAEMAERAAFTGLNTGGQGSGAFDTTLMGIREGESDDIAAFEADLVGDEIDAQREQLNTAMMIAESVGATTEANALRWKIAQLDEQYRRDVFNQDTTNWRERMDFDWDQLEAFLNRQAMLDAMGG